MNFRAKRLFISSIATSVAGFGLLFLSRWRAATISSIDRSHNEVLLFAIVVIPAGVILFLSGLLLAGFALLTYALRKYNISPVKIQLILTGVLFIGTFISVAVVLGGIGVYCTRSEAIANSHFICADAQTNASTLAEVLHSAISWLALIGLPTQVALIFWRVTRPAPLQQEESR